MHMRAFPVRMAQVLDRELQSMGMHITMAIYYGFSNLPQEY